MKVTSDEIIKRFNELYKELERVPTRDEMGYRQPINRIYGGYNNFLRKMGHLPNFLRNEEDYIKFVKKLYKELNKVPSLNDLENKGVSGPSIYKIFDSYNDLLEKAGLETKEITYTDKTKEELLSDYIELCNELGRWAKTRELESIDIYENRFSSIIEVRKLVVNDKRLKIKNKAIKGPHYRKYTDDDIREYVEGAIKKYGKDIIKADMVKYLKEVKGPSVNTITKRYKTTSFRNMIKKHIEKYFD